MTDFSMRVHSTAFEKDLNTMTRNVDAASRDALRDIGRGVVNNARRRVRVYRGPRRTWSVNGGPKRPVISGELRRSISGYSQVRRTSDNGYVVKVGPRGGHVHLYAQKIERLDHYMAEAAATAHSEARSTAGRRWDKAIRQA